MISTHVLDTSLGKPAEGIEVVLEHQTQNWVEVGRGTTNADGRCTTLLASVAGGAYRLTFATQAYFERTGRPSLYPEVVIVFQAEEGERYHIPLLLSPFGYSTYRGS